MFCKYCGKEIDVDTVYCPFCGRKVETDGMEDADQTIVFGASSEEPWFVNEQYEKEKNRKEEPASPKKNVKKPAIIATICVIIAAGLGIGAYFLFGGNGGDEVDLKELITGPIVSGYDGTGKIEAELHVDEQKMDAYLETIRNEERRSAVKGVLLTVVYHPDKYEKLSNGDAVTINAEYDRSMAADIGLKVTNESFSYVIESLEEGEDIAYDPVLCDSYPNDFLFTESDDMLLSEEGLYDGIEESESNAQRAINEIYARHGLIFDDSYYKQLYEKCEWYTPVYTKDQFKSSWFNQYENANLKKMTDYRQGIRDYNAEMNKTVTCANCGKKIKMIDAVEDYGSYYCEACFYDSPEGQEYYNDY